MCRGSVHTAGLRLIWVQLYIMGNYDTLKTLFPVVVCHQLGSGLGAVNKNVDGDL